MSRIWLPGFLLLIFLPSVQGADAPVGKVVSTKGDATIAHGLDPKKPAAAGDPVFEKDRIKTGTDGEVVVDMNGASKITVGPDSYFKITGTQDKKTELNLFSGQVKCKVNKLEDGSAFTVKTPSAVAGVRGTEFETQLDSQMNTLVAVEEGTVWNADPEQPDNVMVVNQGQCGLLLATGDAIKGSIEPGSSVLQLAQKMMGEMQDKAVQSALGSMDAKMDEMRAQKLQELEDRIQLIESRLQFLQAEAAKKDLPEPPTTPL